MEQKRLGTRDLQYLHHEHHGVEGDHHQHGVLEGGRGHKVPEAVLHRLPVLGHVARHGLGAHGEVDAGPLRNEKAVESVTQDEGE